jgi:glycosyltransferase involved in cell wall biosynthesis
MGAKISLVMTVYNRESYLKAAIESVLAQTRTDWQLLVWDDGSSDGSLAIAKSYQALDPRIEAIAASRQGRVAALAAAHERVTGSYIGWLDSDDLLAPRAIEVTAAVLDDLPGIGMVYTDYLTIDEAGKVLGKGKRCSIPYSKNRLLVDFMTFHFRLFRRSKLEEAGGIDVSIPVAVDYDLCLRLSEVTQIVRVPESLYYYRWHRGSISIQQRSEQMLWAKEAIQRALIRRGLSDMYAIELDLTGNGGRYRLHKIVD